MRVVLGNHQAIHTVKKDGEEVVVDLPDGKYATEIEPREGKSLSDVFLDVTRPDGVWANHAVDGSTPAWVASDNASLSTLLSEHFGGVEIRKLENSGGAGGGSLPLLLAMPALALLFYRLSPTLKTNLGNDFQAKQMAGSASATAVAKWMALTANVTAASASDSALTGEITTAGGGLLRVAATYAHTTSAASYTLTNTFTANGSDALPVTIGKVGVFDAASAGNLVFETLLGTTATLSASGDALTVTQTVTL